MSSAAAAADAPAAALQSAALRLLAAGDYDSAAFLGERLVSAAPADESARAVLGEAYLHGGGGGGGAAACIALRQGCASHACRFLAARAAAACEAWPDVEDALLRGTGMAGAHETLLCVGARRARRVDCARASVLRGAAPRAPSPLPARSRHALKQPGGAALSRIPRGASGVALLALAALRTDRLTRAADLYRLALELDPFQVRRRCAPQRPRACARARHAQTAHLTPTRARAALVLCAAVGRVRSVVPPGHGAAR